LAQKSKFDFSFNLPQTCIQSPEDKLGRNSSHGFGEIVRFNTIIHFYDVVFQL